MVNAKTFGVYPAAKALLSAVLRGRARELRQRAQGRGAVVVNILMNPSSSAMIRSAVHQHAGPQKGANRPRRPTRRSAAWRPGRGMMGAGIAHVAPNAGIEVVLVDSTQEAAERGRGHSEKLLDKDLSRRRISEEKNSEVLAASPPRPTTRAQDCD
jgi:3-hydroxyacyl-CoA dehydrogenase/enoyl-CoA hydratase/3-hydroxybutyryl-CoA epimerase